MDTTILREKILEYQNRAAQITESADPGEQEGLKKMYQTLSILYRLAFRMAQKKVSRYYAVLREMERAQDCMKQSNIAFPFGKAYRNQLFQKLYKANIERKKVACYLIQSLDNWQSAGATLEEFAHFCNRTPEWIRQTIEIEDQNETFSTLLLLYDLDFKDPGGKAFSVDEIDAPLTQSIREVIRNPFLLQSWKMVQKTLKIELRKHAVRVIIDANGTGHLVNKTGVELGILEDSSP